MKKLPLLLLFLLAGCLAPGRLPSFPQATQPTTELAEITVIRTKNFVGSAGATQVWLDGKEIVRLNIGNYTTFFVQPGVHSVGGYSGGTVAISFEKGRSYYILLDVTFPTLIDKEEAIKRMSKGRKI